MTTLNGPALRFVGVKVANPEHIVDCEAIHEVYTAARIAAIVAQ